MQKNEMAAKAKLYWDGVEVPGLVSVGEIKLENSTIEVPEFARLRTLNSNIVKVPPLELKYKVDRGKNTLKFWRDFKNNNEVHDGVLVYTDAHGTEYDKILLPQTECNAIAYPPYDAASPQYAAVTITVLPYDYIPVAVG